MFSFPYSRLDAVAHGGNPQDCAASLLPVPCSLFPVPFGIGIGIWMGKIVLASARVKYGAKQVLPLIKIPQP
ncbi:MAG: hypothetical protein F6K63_05720 [Moorea sp. SIO1G6]|uniref:hypothetical protein n=1 Tax=Moorena sp. SIO1G6 TaxID=2607840 RepID=UPI0013C21A24|nr:hypothetical protein [Moorena sp. SIO1G6]NET63932.1 hypothetical protein [Moorena sp. SIO1G6]